MQLHGLGAARAVSPASPVLVGVVMDKIEPYSAILEVASRFEPDANRLPLETKILLSIAISVKRIADEQGRRPRRWLWRW